MLGIKMLPASVLLAAFAFTAHAPVSGATIFLPANVTSSPVPSRAIRVATAGVPAASPAPETEDQVPMMWAMLTGSFALIGMIVRRKKRSPSVTA